MNRPRNGRDWAGLIAIILAVTLSAVLLITVIGTVVFDADLTPEGGRLLTTVSVGLVGVLGTLIGIRRHRNGGGE